jgi:sugar phosphate isomerase/epimerase
MQIDRRGFLLGSAAFAVSPIASLAAAKDASAIRLSVATYSFRNFDRATCIRNIKELGVKYCDIKEKHLPYKDTPEQLAAGRKEFDAAGITVVGGGNIDMKSDDEAELRKMFDYAKACGFKMMIMAPTQTNMGKIEKLCVEYKIKAAIHNHGPEDKFFPTPQSALAVIKNMDPLVGLCIDIGHTSRTGADIVESIAEAGPRVHELHMKDLKDAKDKASQVAVGDGVLPIPAIFAQLVKMKYTGVCSLEYEINGNDPMPGMKKSFDYMRKVAADMKA